MSLKNDAQSCQICHAYLFDEDDIVYCPICGAPHHRECYNVLNHCGAEQLHGTEMQYDLQKKASKSEQKEPPKTTDSDDNICRFCMNKIDSDAKVCPYCGRPRIPAHFAFDVFGGVDPAQDIGEGVTAKRTAEFVTVNTQRYVPVFASLTKKRKVSWNWMAFIFPHAWYFSRKMHKYGFLFLSLAIAFEVLSMPLLKITNSVMLSGYAQYVDYIVSNISSFGYMPLILSFAGGILNIAVRIVSGLFGNSIYKSYTISKIKEIDSSAEDTVAQNRKYGGVNLLAGIGGILASMYIPNIIFMFL